MPVRALNAREQSRKPPKCKTRSADLPTHGAKTGFFVFSLRVLPSRTRTESHLCVTLRNRPEFSAYYVSSTLRQSPIRRSCFWTRFSTSNPTVRSSLKIPSILSRKLFSPNHVASVTAYRRRCYLPSPQDFPVSPGRVV